MTEVELHSLMKLEYGTNKIKQHLLLFVTFPKLNLCMLNSFSILKLCSKIYGKVEVDLTYLLNIS